MYRQHGSMAVDRRIARINIAECSGDRVRRRQDEIAVEEPMEIRIFYHKDGRLLSSSIAVTMRTPGNDFELAAGFLYSEGIISDRRDIDKITYCLELEEEQRYNVVSIYLSPWVRFEPEKLSRNTYTTSSCGVCGKTSIELVQASCRTKPRGEFRISGSLLTGLLHRLRSSQSLFTRTGGLHASALFTNRGELIVVREDIGRHNAMDKLIGNLLLNNKLPAHDTIAMVSGRAGFEIVQKTAMAGIPFLASVGAPSSLAVSLARSMGITLVGFLREGRFNIYSGEERIAP